MRGKWLGRGGGLMPEIDEYYNTPKLIVEDLKKEIPFFDKLLKSKEKWILAKHNCSSYICAVMENYKNHFAAQMTKEDGLVIYMLLALRGLSRGAVFKLFKQKRLATDLRYLEPMSQLIMDAYNEKLQNFFKSAYEFNLAYEIVGRDPIGRYLAHKKTLSDAALEIQEICVKTSLDKMNVRTVLLYMFICYQCEMTIYTLNDIHSGEPRVDGGFGICGTIGEIPESLFKSLFVLEKEKCVWVAPPHYGYHFTGSAMKNLNLLYKAVISLEKLSVREAGLRFKPPKLKTVSKQFRDISASKPSVKKPSVKKIKENIEETYPVLKKPLRKSRNLKPPGQGPGTSPITQRQYRYLRSLPNYTFILEYGTTNETLKKRLIPGIEASKELVKRVRNFLNVAEKTAETVARTCVQYLEEKAPITLAVQSTFPFKEAQGKFLQEIELAEETVGMDKIADEQMPMTKARNGAVKSRPKMIAYVHKEDHVRGVHYMRWRRNKEEEMTKYHQFRSSEYAVYAAVDLIVEYMDHPQGPDYYYGPHHFLLANDVKTRSSFTMGAADMKATRSMVDIANRLSDDLFTMLILRAYSINNIRTNCKSVFPSFEIQIYGDIRFKEDVIYFMECTNFQGKELNAQQKKAKTTFADREKVLLKTYDGAESYKKKLAQVAPSTGDDIRQKIDESNQRALEKRNKWWWWIWPWK